MIQANAEPLDYAAVCPHCGVVRSWLSHLCDADTIRRETAAWLRNGYNVVRLPSGDTSSRIGRHAPGCPSAPAAVLPGMEDDHA